MIIKKHHKVPSCAYALFCNVGVQNSATNILINTCSSSNIENLMRVLQVVKIIAALSHGKYFEISIIFTNDYILIHTQCHIFTNAWLAIISLNN